MNGIVGACRQLLIVTLLTLKSVEYSTAAHGVVRMNGRLSTGMRGTMPMGYSIIVSYRRHGDVRLTLAVPAR